MNLKNTRAFVLGGGAAAALMFAACGGGGAENVGPKSPWETNAKPDVTVQTELNDYLIRPEFSSVKQGAIAFAVKNLSQAYHHEFTIARLSDSGEQVGEPSELLQLDAGESGKTVQALSPGRYRLACLIFPGEAGSQVNHFDKGMYVEFDVVA